MEAPAGERQQNRSPYTSIVINREGRNGKIEKKHLRARLNVSKAERGLTVNQKYGLELFCTQKKKVRRKVFFVLPAENQRDEMFVHDLLPERISTYPKIRVCIRRCLYLLLADMRVFLTGLSEASYTLLPITCTIHSNNARIRFGHCLKREKQNKFPIANAKTKPHITG